MSFIIGRVLGGALGGLSEIGAAAESGTAAAAASTATGGGLGGLGLGTLDNIVGDLVNGSGDDGSVNALAQLAGSMLGTNGAASQTATSADASAIAPDVGVTVPQPSTSAQSTFRSFSSMQPQAQGGDPNAQILGGPDDSGGSDAGDAA